MREERDRVQQKSELVEQVLTLSAVNIYHHTSTSGRHDGGSHQTEE